MTNIKKKGKGKCNKRALGPGYVGDPASSYHVYANDAETNQVHDCTVMVTLISLETNLLYQPWNRHGIR
jgi:hypothetical protein